MNANLAIQGSTEILQIADAVSREKGIPKDAVLEAMEQAIGVAARRKYGHDKTIRVDIDRKTGAIQLFRVRQVVESEASVQPDENGEGGFSDQTHILLKDAQKIDPEIELGGEIKDALPPIDFGRVAAQTAKQVIVQRVRDAEREIQFEDFKDRVGEIVNGVVKRVEYGNSVVEIGRTEGFLRRDQMIPREAFRPGDRIRAYVAEVKRERTGPQVILSRTHPIFMAKLFAQEVPEIYDGVIEVKAVARDPGSRAKIAVFSHDLNIDPVGSCVGVRGSRVQAVVGELQGEKIDIIQWSGDLATLVVNALTPAEVAKVVIDENAHKVEVVVPEESLSQAIGRRGQNVRLASQLIGWDIDVMTEEQESKKRAEEFKRHSELFINALNVEEVIAQLLVVEGFTNVQEVADVSVQDLASIEGFDEGVASALQARAKEYLEKREKELEQKITELGVEKDLRELEGLSLELLAKLAEKGIKTRDDLADLAREDFKELVPVSGLKDAEIDELIMRARAHWFADEAKGEGSGARA